MKLEEISNQVIDLCDSTNDLARQLGEAGYPHGTWVSARAQNKGRGRLGRQWQSMEGNLFLSILARPARKDLWTWVPMATAIGIAHALVDLFPGFPVRVKWPNDLWADGKKLGGILCEAIGGRGDSFIIIGIGLNCSVAHEGLDQLTTSISDQIGRRITADDVRGTLIPSVLEWTSRDPQQIRESYEKFAAFPPGTQIQWAEGKESGAVVGLGPSGELRVAGQNGEVNLYAEDVKIRAL